MSQEDAGGKTGSKTAATKNAGMTTTVSETITGNAYTFNIRYNDQGKFYTADLSITATGEVLCYGDPIRYGRPMFGSIEDDRYPIPVIIPYCLEGKETEITEDNFGKSVKLYLHERREV